MTNSNLTSHVSRLTSNHYVIVVAGGSGTRMGSAVPKQFLALNGLPVLMHTLIAFNNSTYAPQIILVLPADFHQYWQELCTQHHFEIPHQLISGGETRFHSVNNGLQLIPDGDDIVVAVHDAVRPLTDIAIIDSAYAHAVAHGNAVVAVKSRDSIRQVVNGQSASLVRDEIYLVQTPQTFRLSQIREAYNQPFDTKFTDDASVVEAAGFSIDIIEGNHRNIKITFPEDIAIAELLLNSGKHEA